MQPATTAPAATPKKSNKLRKGLLYTAFALAVGGHFYSDYSNSQIREAQTELIQLQDALIEAQGVQIKLLEQGGAESGGGSCDDGFIIEDIKPRGPIQVKTVKPPVARQAKTV